MEEELKADDGTSTSGDCVLPSLKELKIQFCKSNLSLVHSPKSGHKIHPGEEIIKGNGSLANSSSFQTKFFSTMFVITKILENYSQLAPENDESIMIPPKT